MRLEQKALNIKQRFMNMYHQANAGHIGSSLSCCELLTVAKFAWMNDKDRLVLSKGHAAAALYSLLAEAGEISESEISTFYGNGTRLPAHPPVNQFDGIPFATGSLGHGLSLAAGFGMSAKLAGTNQRVYCICSDGELNEGSTWEAAMFIAHQRLTNVVLVVDHNGLQGFGNTQEVINMDPLKDKFEAFGFHTITVSGHDCDALAALKAHFHNTDKPIAILAKTIKGNGWKSLENQLACHYLPIPEQDYQQMMQQMEGGKDL